MYTRKQRLEIAEAMRMARPYAMDSDSEKTRNDQAWRWMRDTYVNCCERLADMVGCSGNSEERQIFLSNCRAITIEPFWCSTCGQNITDGKPCGHGRRDALGIV